MTNTKPSILDTAREMLRARALKEETVAEGWEFYAQASYDYELTCQEEVMRRLAAL